MNGCIYHDSESYDTDPIDDQLVFCNMCAEEKPRREIGWETEVSSSGEKVYTQECSSCYWSRIDASTFRTPSPDPGTPTYEPITTPSPGLGTPTHKPNTEHVSNTSKAHASRKSDDRDPSDLIYSTIDAFQAKFTSKSPAVLVKEYDGMKKRYVAVDSVDTDGEENAPHKRRQDKVPVCAGGEDGLCLEKWACFGIVGRKSNMHYDSLVSLRMK